MSIAPLGAGFHFPTVAPATLPTSPAAPGGQQFSGLVAQFLQDTNSQQLEVAQQIEALAAGDTDNVHDVVLSVAKADLSFRLVMEIRNRLISSYQELMRMQV